MCCAPFATDGDVTPLFLIISWKGVMFLFYRKFENSEAILNVIFLSDSIPDELTKVKFMMTITL